MFKERAFTLKNKEKIWVSWIPSNKEQSSGVTVLTNNLQGYFSLYDKSGKFLENIEVELSVEVGRTEITIRELLRLNEGSIVELDRLAGDPLDILANGTKIARGEIVMIGERYGVRFGDIVDPVKRVESVS